MIAFGSAMIAATKPKKKFDGYILIEKSTKYCEALQKLIPNALVIKPSPSASKHTNALFQIME